MATWPKFRPFLPDLKHLGPVLLAWGIAILVMTAQKDLGSSLLLFFLFIAMLWVATGKVAYPVAGAGLFAVASYGAWTQFSHVQARVDAWLNPWIYPKEGYQVVQGWYAMAWGGIGGTGIGLGRPDKVPYVASDFIFVAIAEELGLLGGAAILIAYLLFIGAGLRTAVQADHSFDKLLATGLTALLGFQAFVILAGVTRLLPLTGVVLPFVAYGGSALVANYVLLALLIRISDGNSRAARSAAPTAAVV
jgi:peptidoglycan glycosyltransferase